ncbi:efflux RND transporter periplasmic adaptor subunit [Burkholderia sp. WAC0059]|uniref:efflux RND transporter periplasmic adaptor subunit n=1 Tax=Burkholderia sp. WAC0059 TaxID=2066022 RepID=UPI000C7F1441|nr:efflux RND transporter periplasmic adaptor subunit [Burkholderia sp. WAC0059]PLZ02941.1 efflux RND transporter periplasmic adaptor subunit [Burkholderia sp. WAC0059]
MSSESLTPENPPSRRRLVVAGVIGLALVVVIVVAGVSVRVVDARDLSSWTAQQAVPTVTVVSPQPVTHGPTLQLPGRLEAWSRAPIFARVSGYLQSWSVDIGTPVKAGQQLAVIDTPELDQQLVQARADLRTAQANAQLAGITAKRWQALAGTDSVAQQDIDTRTSDYAAREAAVAAAQANVERLVAMKGFARIVAPFNGVVTSRDTDIGALINAGTGGPGQQLFTVSDVKQLRLYVQVPQNFAPLVKPGFAAQLSVPAYAGQEFPAKVIATADAVNANSGTTLVQLVVDNSAGKLLPGGFASVTFRMPAQGNALDVPASALVFDNRGLLVATVDAQNRVRFKHVTINHDFGSTIEIGAGLAATDRVIDTPPDGLVDGDQVELSSATANAGKTGAPAHG